MISPLGVFGRLDGLGRQEIPVVLVDGVADAVAFEAEHVQAGLEPALLHIPDDLVDRVVDALHHAREHEARLHHVLVGVDADHEMRGPAACVASPFLDGVERAKPGIARGREDHVRALRNLRERQLLAPARVVPRRVGHADVVLDDADVRD